MALTAVCGSSYGLEYEPHSATSCDARGRSRLEQFFSQSGDVGVDDVRAGIEMHVPDLVVKLTSRDSLSGSKHKVFQELQLHGCEANVFTVARDAAGQAIQREIARIGLFADARAAGSPSDERSYAGAKLLVRDWLDDIIIGAGVQTANDGFSVGATRVEKHGSVSPVPPQLLKNLES